MCGIWAFISNSPISPETSGKYFNAFQKIKHRGPDYSRFDLVHPYALLGFHRLAILDESIRGMQPFCLECPNKKIYSITNGEIYNFSQIKKEYSIQTYSSSDCEMILPLFQKIKDKKLFFEKLGSEFATIILEISENEIKAIVGRDPVGIRPLFYAHTAEGLYLSSEMKGLVHITSSIEVFPPGCFMEYSHGTSTLKIERYHSFPVALVDRMNPIAEGTAMEHIRHVLIRAVLQRLNSDRKFGCLLSGGLDSSLIAGICRYLLPYEDFPVFTISFRSGGTDLPYAMDLSQKLGLKHHILYIDEEDALKEIENVIYAIESYDTTTVRASIMQKMLCRYISQNTDVKVLLVGENSDELFNGYLYSHLAPSAELLREDANHLVKDVHRFDALRTDRTAASEGLEIRVPFADVELVDYVFSLNSEFTSPKDKMEKYLLRNAFAWNDIIPKNILFRRKEAFSDAVSSKENSWYSILQKHIENIVSPSEFEKGKIEYSYHNAPRTKEEYYYRKIFHRFFPSRELSKTIPYFWMPKWTEETMDPSARTLKIYNDSILF
jgi:asparagine synthase (glutamine-hydrolysing)